MGQRYIPANVKTGAWPALAAGRTGTPQNITQGGAKGIGKIVFTGDIIADDTITVNGKVFTCMASGAAGEFQFDVGVSLSASLDALVTLLNACTDPLVSIATYTKTDTNTAVTATMDNYGTQYNGAGFALASNHATVVITPVAGGQAQPSLSLNTENNSISLSQDTDQDLALGDGVDFQWKTIHLKAKTGAGNLVVHSPNFSAGTTATFNAANDFLVLKWLGGKWWPIFNNSVTIA